MPQLLIHSLAEFREILFELLAVTAARHVVEVGSESGGFTEELARWAAAHDARLTTIDPFPTDRVRQLAAELPHRLLAARTPGALDGLEPADVYLLDGDHNHWTVTEELKRIHATSPGAVVVLHDVGWPWARRDLYYDPTQLPPEAVHPCSFEKGVHVDQKEPIDGGFRSHGAYAIALHEGGPKNGVRTAIDDFLAEHSEHELFVIPAVFGLGVLVPSRRSDVEAIRALLRPYHENPLLSRLELNRLRNYLQVIALQDRLQVVEAERDAAQGATHVEKDSTARLVAERDRLLRDKQELERKLAALEERWYTRLGARLDGIKRPSS